MESLSLSTVVVGMLLLKTNDPFYALLLSVCLYSDILFSIWFIDVSWIRRSSVVVGPFLVSFCSESDDLCILLLCIGCYILFLQSFVLPHIRSVFSISEVVLYWKWLVVLTALLLNSQTRLSTRVAVAVFLMSVSLTALVLANYFLFPTRIPPSVIYAFIAAGAATEIAALSHLVHRPFISWFIDWIFYPEKETDFSLRRVLTLVYWFVCLFLALTPWAMNALKKYPVIVQRKYFHYLCVILFLPCFLRDPDFMEFALFPTLMNRVAFAFALLVFLLMEIARLTALPPFQGLDGFMKQYVDDRDSGPLIITHFSLLLGCALPLWVDRSGETWSAMAGVIMLGVGDATAAIVGKEWGRHRFSNGRSLEGSLGFTGSSIIFCVVVGWWKGQRITPCHVIAVALAAVMEAVGEELDNYVLPMYFATVFSFLSF